MQSSHEKYRIFISYSHEDEEMVSRIARIIEENEMDPMWDKKFQFGQGFHEQIKNFIAHSDVFLPVLTLVSDSRKWVHQEIGYAMAMGIPVIPLAIGELPREMIQQIHAICVDPENIDILKKTLSPAKISFLIEQSLSPFEVVYTIAPLQEERAMVISRYADEVFGFGKTGIVRQKGGLSSFNIPPEILSNPLWTKRYGALCQGDLHKKLQRSERLALQRHADAAGCKLIINPYLQYAKYGTEARKCRLQTLKSFLEKQHDEVCTVAIHKDMDPRASITILGTWFFAESLAGVDGTKFEQTVFTKHAPTVRQKVSEFDQEFDTLLADEGIHPLDSRRYVIDILDCEISG